MSASLREIVAGLATTIDAGISAGLPGVQVEGGLLYNPTPPSVDMYPDNPFLAQTAMRDSWEATWVVRARVSTAAHAEAQGLLLDLLDPRSPISVLAAINTDPTLGGTVDDEAVVSAGSGFTAYPETESGSFLGVEWRVTVVI